MSQGGEIGERLAEQYLIGRNFRVIERNWRAGKLGEVDLIAYDGPVLAFIEVKARFSDQFGAPQSAVTAGKQRQLVKLARLYLYRQGLYGKTDCRFDVVAITFVDRQPVIEHIPDAFRAR